MLLNEFKDNQLPNKYFLNVLPNKLKAKIDYQKVFKQHLKGLEEIEFFSGY